MLEKLRELWSQDKNRHVAFVAGGMLGIMTGAKAAPLTAWAVGLRGLEREWRKAHPEHDGTWDARWKAALEFYDETHRNPVNRVLHTVGIPMIVGGMAGMVLAPRYTPPWWLANGSYTAGWVLNFVGHGFFEKSAPAFADDPLSFFAGPAWDVIRLREKLFGDRTPTERAPDRGATAHA